MSFLICKKCKAGIHTKAIPVELRVELGWIDGKHLQDGCGGETEIVSDQNAGVGPEYEPPTGSN
jgi:hypothetical protein